MGDAVSCVRVSTCTDAVNVDEPCLTTASRTVAAAAPVGSVRLTVVSSGSARVGDV